MALAMLLPKQAQGLLLASNKGQVEHQGAVKKKKYDTTKFQLCLMQWQH
jgi:hypothetical protein